MRMLRRSFCVAPQGVDVSNLTSADLRREETAAALDDVAFGPGAAPPKPATSALGDAAQKLTDAGEAERRRKEAEADAKALAERLARQKEAHDQEGQQALDARARQFEQERDAYDKFYEDLGQKAEDFYTEKAEREAQAIRRADDALLDLQIELAQARADALRDVDAEEFAKADEQLAQLLAQRMERESEQQLQGLEEGGEAARQLNDLFQQQRDAMEKQHADARTAIAKQEADAKLAVQLQSVQQVAGALAAIFAKNKTVAVATAIIDTLAGAVAALKNGGGVPWGIPPMIATLAAGYARVQAIRSVSADAGAGGSGGGGAAAAPQPPPPVQASGSFQASLGGAGLAGGFSLPAGSASDATAAAAVAASSPVVNDNRDMSTRHYHLIPSGKVEMERLAGMLDNARARDATKKW